MLNKYQLRMLAKQDPIGFIREICLMFFEEVLYWLSVPFVFLFFVILTLVLPFIMRRPDEKR